jgi:hypothetical protein
VNSVIPEVETAPSPRAVAHLGTSKKNLQLDYEIDEDSEPDESKPENTCLLQINTAAEGFNFGRIYTLRFNDEIEIETWKEALLALSASDKLSYNRRTYISRQQQKIREFYDCKTVQYSAAFLIIVNFFIEAVSLQFNFAKDSSQAQILDNIDTLFTVVFLLELLVNMAGVCVHACVRVYSLSLSLTVSDSVCSCVFMCEHIQTHRQTHTHSQTHTHTLTHTHTHTHTHTIRESGVQILH